MKINNQVNVSSGYINTDSNISYDLQMQSKKYDTDLKKITQKEKNEIQDEKNRKEQKPDTQLQMQTSKQMRDRLFHYQTPEQISYMISQGKGVSDAQKNYVREVKPALLQEAERSRKIQDLLSQMQSQENKLKQIEQQYFSEQRNRKIKEQTQEKGNPSIVLKKQTTPIKPR